MALKYANLKVILRDVELSNLPQEALAVSPHATVPSLVISDSEFMDESWDIVKWAAIQNDPDNWLGVNNQYLKDAEMLIEINDFSWRLNYMCSVVVKWLGNYLEFKELMDWNKKNKY